MKQQFLLISTLFLTTACTQAATLYSNVGGPYIGIETGAGITLATQLVATDFMTGAGASIITGAELHVVNDDFVDDHTYIARLYSDVGNSPNSLLATFTPAGVNTNLIPAGNGQLIYFSHAGISLAANTRYWLALGLLENVDTIGGNTGFMSRVADTTDPVSGFSNSSPPGMFLSTDSGSSWTAASATSNGEFTLTGSLVPEPSRAMMLLASVLSMLCRRQRTKPEGC